MAIQNQTITVLNIQCRTFTMCSWKRNNKQIKSTCSLFFFFLHLIHLEHGNKTPKSNTSFDHFL